MTVLINAANLRVGGGVQVASSFLDELVALRADKDVAARFPWIVDSVHVVASRSVLSGTRPETSTALNVSERSAAFDREARCAPPVDVSFTIFGPEYVPYRSGHRIVGFADATALFPGRIPSEMRARPARQALRRRVSRHRFKQADTIVTETRGMARDLAAVWGLPSERIHVVPNATHGVFDTPESWAPSPLARTEDVPHVLFVTRGYPHKNLKILGPVGDVMLAHGQPVRFVLTLNAQDWKALPASTRIHSVNLGPVQINELPRLYESCDASIFPSLLETFSVTPLEALRTGTPLVASDRDFVRDVAGDIPYYADPHDPTALAEALDTALANGHDDRVEAGVRAAKEWPTARERALAYVGLIDSALLGRASG